MNPDQIKVLFAGKEVKGISTSLSDETCDKFRRLSLPFNDMVRTIFHIAIKYGNGRTGGVFVDDKEVQELIEDEWKLFKTE